MGSLKIETPAAAVGALVNFHEGTSRTFEF